MHMKTKATVAAGTRVTCRQSGNSHARLCRLPLGAIRAKGWLARQLRVEARGMSGHMDELEPDMIGNPYITRSRKEGVSAAWCAEISATYWTGLVQLAFTLNDPLNNDLLAVEGALKKDARLVHQSIVHDPLTAAVLSLAEIRKMTLEMFARNKEYLRGYKGEI
jgi:hypothetical protein